jgi:hypothetical protein
MDGYLLGLLGKKGGKKQAYSGVQVRGSKVPSGMEVGKRQM